MANFQWGNGGYKFHKRRPPVRPDSERNVLVEENLRLVYFVWHTIARRYPMIRMLGEEDACQVGHMGLMRAAELWEAGRSKFSTYATHWILQYMQRAA